MIYSAAKMQDQVSVINSNNYKYFLYHPTEMQFSIGGECTPDARQHCITP